MEAEVRSPCLVNIDPSTSGMCRGDDPAQIRGNPPLGWAGDSDQPRGRMCIQRRGNVLGGYSEPNVQRLVQPRRHVDRSGSGDDERRQK